MAKAPLPKVVAVKVPQGPSAPGPQPDGDSPTVATLVAMIERGEVTAAAAAARGARGNDVRLALLGELLDIAEQLPLAITIAIAHSVSVMEMEKARAAVIAYRSDNPADAYRVTRLLAKRAPAVSAYLGNVSVPGVYNAPGRPVRNTGSRLGVAASLLVMGLTASRCGSLSTHHSYDYQMPNIDLRALDFKMPEVHLDPALFALSSVDRLASPQEHLLAIADAAGEIIRDGDPSQVLAARDIRKAALEHDCGQLIDAASTLGVSDNSRVAFRIADITVRVDLACPSR